MIDKKKYENINVLVIGDTCIDKFSYGSVVRLAPEAPVPVINPEYSIENKGMAGNVEENIKSIGGNTILLSNYESVLKHRLVDKRSNQILLRIDENDKVSRIDRELLIRIKNNHFNNVKIDAIIISDYDKGFLDEEDIQFICENNTNVFIDTKKILDTWCVNSTFIKINHVEYEHTKFNLKDLSISDKLIITLSSDGCQYKDKIYPVEKVKIKDVSGAGDTFMSALVLEYVRTLDIEKSILFAQECATIVVQKIGVTTI
jgi:bifunctional ADP-heptose synthase (sugar kinase/adenylyltransferase)